MPLNQAAILVSRLVADTSTADKYDLFYQKINEAIEMPSNVTVAIANEVEQPSFLFETPL